MGAEEAEEAEEATGVGMDMDVVGDGKEGIEVMGETEATAIAGRGSMENGRIVGETEMRDAVALVHALALAAAIVDEGAVATLVHPSANHNESQPVVMLTSLGE